MEAFSQEDQKWMSLALEEARHAAGEGEIPVGAVVVHNGLPIAVAHNRCENDHDATAHAETLAISAACKALCSWRLSDCTLYVTLEPCPMCMGAAINARVNRIVYGAKNPRAGACESLIRLPKYPLEASPACFGGFLQEECLEILHSFFAEKRK